MEKLVNIPDVVIPELLNWFESYVLKYHIEDPTFQFHIDLKHTHTLNVCQNCVQIGSMLKLESSIIRILWVIGLFHDIARFPQFHQFHTFKDHLTYNHGDKAVDILQQEKILDLYFPDTKNQILQAIRLHNRAELPSDVPSNVLLLANVIRDADKLDILRFFVEYYTSKRGFQTVIDIELPDIPEISLDIIDSLQNDRYVKLSSIKTLNDFKLMQFRWVYEFNFIPSLQILNEKKYINKIYDTMPSNSLIQSYYRKTMNVISEKLQKYF